MITLSHDQRFHWLEPFAFARARAAATPSGSRLPLVLLFSVLLSLPLVLADTPENTRDIGVVALFAVGGALVIAYLLMPWASRLPNGVLVASDRIVIGREVIPFSQIQHAVVGTSMMGGKEFPVLSFVTKPGQSYLFGLGRKVNPKELSEFLERAGVREPQA